MKRIFSLRMQLALLEKVEQVVRRIRLKGVGFTLLPKTLNIFLRIQFLVQLENRSVCLRAYMPKEMKAIKYMPKASPESRF